MKDKSDIEESFQLDNETVRNTLFCLKRGLSTADFVALNFKDSLQIDFRVPTKNNSKFEFFQQRPIIYEFCSENLKNAVRGC